MPWNRQTTPGHLMKPEGCGTGGTNGTVGTMMSGRVDFGLIVWMPLDGTRLIVVTVTSIRRMRIWLIPTLRTICAQADQTDRALPYVPQQIHFDPEGPHECSRPSLSDRPAAR